MALQAKSQMKFTLNWIIDNFTELLLLDFIFNFAFSSPTVPPHKMVRKGLKIEFLEQRYLFFSGIFP